LDGGAANWLVPLIQDDTDDAASINWKVLRRSQRTGGDGQVCPGTENNGDAEDVPRRICRPAIELHEAAYL
jgi:hypothetical protein